MSILASLSMTGCIDLESANHSVPIDEGQRVTSGIAEQTVCEMQIGTALVQLPVLTKITDQQAGLRGVLDAGVFLSWDNATRRRIDTSQLSNRTVVAFIDRFGLISSIHAVEPRANLISEKAMTGALILEEDQFENLDFKEGDRVAIRQCDGPEKTPRGFHPAW